jgi:dTDP-4-amino-4,6-dideoxygalactose transaminase
MSRLAILGGPPVITKPLASYAPHGKEERDAAKAVIDSGVLSQFYGCWDDAFFGGSQVRGFERAWENHFKVAHAVAVNSATSGLIAAVGALDIEPGDEIIVSPWTMCASATAILVWNAVPVFADIEDKTFNLDPEAIERKITSRTKAILVPDIFGHAADLKKIMQIAKKHGLKVIEDASQAPGAKCGEHFVGTIADIGVFSLNYHKHIHTGEGGVCVTNDPELAERMQLIRNHAEAVVGDKGVTNIANMIGFNFRLGEVEAAIGIEQLKKLERLALKKTRSGERLTEGLKGLRGLKTPVVQPDCTHVYYVYGMTVDTQELKVPHSKLVKALQAEGIPDLMSGYVNVHLLPMYQKKIAYGKRGFPWVKEIYSGEVSYEKGICPVAEGLNNGSFIGIQLCSQDYSDSEVDLVIEAFKKVWSNLDALRE